MNCNLLNVINYLSGADYNIDTIYSDIEKSIILFESPSNFYLVNNLKKLLVFQIKKRAREAVNFIDYIHNNDIKDPLIVKFYDKYLLPFRDSRNPLIDQFLFSSIFHSENLSLSNLIYTLAISSDHNYADYQTHSLLFLLLGENDIDFPYLEKRRLEISSSIPCPDRIIDNMNFVRYAPYATKKNKYVGDYAQLIAFEFLENKKKSNEILVWASKELGSDMGYDIALLNGYRSAKFYTVKGICSSEFANYSDLEKKTFNSANNSGSAEYHFLLVLTDKNDAIVDIYKDVNNQVHYEFLSGVLDLTFNLDERHKKIRLLNRTNVSL